MVIAEGLFLLQHKGEHKTSRITQLAFDKFGLNPTNCAKVMNVARHYGDRLWLVKGLSRVALYELSAPSTSPAVRKQSKIGCALERRSGRQRSGAYERPRVELPQIAIASTVGEYNEQGARRHHLHCRA